MCDGGARTARGLAKYDVRRVSDVSRARVTSGGRGDVVGVW